MKALLLAVIVLLSAAVAEARTYRIDVIQVAGSFAVQRQDVIAMFAFTQARFAAVGIDIRLRRVASAHAQGPVVTLKNWMRQAWYWQMKLWKQNKNLIYYVVLPPFVDNGSRYIAGLADWFCRIRTPPAIAVGNAQMFNQNGDARFWQSAVVMAHELGHEFGARHEDSVSIMNPGASGLPSPETLVFSPVSSHQMNRCVNGH